MPRFLFKTILFSLALPFFSLLTSCGDDASGSTDADITVIDGKTISSFMFDASEWGLDIDSDTGYEIVLVPEPTDSLISFPANIRIAGGRAECRITLPSTQTALSDGSYRLYLFTPDGIRAGKTLSVSIADRMVRHASLSPALYKPMSGNGSAENPFQIRSQSDFMSLIVALDDEKGIHGKGLFYRQTADVELPPQSGMTGGRGYFSTPFAGFYDGENHKLSGLSYIGASNPEKDCNVGVFSMLLPGATVENVTIEGVDITRAMYCGALAGRSSGNVAIRNVKATGNISQGGNCVGGLIGYAVDTLTVDGFELEMTLSGNGAVGGVVGYADNTCLSVKNVSTRKHRFSLTADNECGGVAGHAAGRVMIDNITLDHSVQSPDGDVRIISASLENGGGIFGRLEISGSSAIRNVNILAPVYSSKSGGGIAGRASTSSELTLSGCRVSSIVSGNEYTGGIFGIFTNTYGGNLVIDGDGCSVITDFNAGEVNGVNYTGGFCGYFTGSAPVMKSKVTIAMNVKSKGNYTGGVFGSLAYASDAYPLQKIYVSDFELDSSTMRVSSTGDHVGGYVGRMQFYDLLDHPSGRGLSDVDGKATPYDADKQTPHFRGFAEGNDYVGGIAGSADRCGLANLCVSGSVTGRNFVGGITGHYSLSYNPYGITNCITTSRASVEAAGNFCGGIAGNVATEYNSGSLPGAVLDCLNTAPVKGKDYTGGIAGRILYDECELELKWSVNTGHVSGSANTGGIVGRADGGNHKLIIENCANYGGIESAAGGGQGLGGIIGATFSQRINVMSCANHGRVMGSGPAAGIGGIAGHLGKDPGGVSQGENVFMAYCMNSGETGCSDSNTHVAGLLGYQEEGTSSHHEDYCVRDSYNDGPVTSDQKSDNGGLVGMVSHYSYILRCVNYGNVSHGNACIGTRQSSAIVYHDYLYYLEGTGKDWYATGKLSRSSLSDRSKYKTFDFDRTWTIANGRAELRHCPWQSIRTFR